MGAVERTTDQARAWAARRRRLPGLGRLDNGATILIMGNLVRGLGQGCRVIGTEGIMELDTTGIARQRDPVRRPDVHARGAIRSLQLRDRHGALPRTRQQRAGSTVEAPWHDAWAHQCQEAIDWVEGRVDEADQRR